MSANTAPVTDAQATETMEVTVRVPRDSDKSLAEGIEDYLTGISAVSSISTVETKGLDPRANAIYATAVVSFTVSDPSTTRDMETVLEKEVFIDDASPA